VEGLPILLRHRLILTTDAELADRTPADVVTEVLGSVTAPGADEIESATAAD
jgi:hypothetical protein